MGSAYYRSAQTGGNPGSRPSTSTRLRMDGAGLVRQPAAGCRRLKGPGGARVIRDQTWIRNLLVWSQFLRFHPKLCDPNQLTGQFLAYSQHGSGRMHVIRGFRERYNHFAAVVRAGPCLHPLLAAGRTDTAALFLLTRSVACLPPSSHRTGIFKF